MPHDALILPWCPCCGTRSTCNCGMGRMDADGPVVHYADRYDSVIQHYARVYGVPWRRVKIRIAAEIGATVPADMESRIRLLCKQMREAVTV